MATVIAFDPEPGFVALIEVLRAQFEVVVIVDNGDGIRTSRLLGALASDPAIIHLRNDGNLGIGTALNRALTYAHDHAVDWMVAFDHDSRVTSGFRATLSEGCGGEALSGVAVIAPLWHRLDGAVDFAEFLDRSTERRVDVPTVITSGSCFNVAIAHAVGAFDESLFIDSVDQEFCLRVRSRGYRVVVDRSLRMDHSLGDEREINWMGRRFVVTDHSATRRYYISRNKIVLWRHYLMRFPRWVVTDIKWHAVDLCKVFLFERNRWRKLVAVVVGNVHGWIGVRSRIPTTTARYLST